MTSHRTNRTDLYRSRHADERGDRKSTRLNSSHGYISYAVFCLKKKKTDAYWFGSGITEAAPLPAVTFYDFICIPAAAQAVSGTPDDVAISFLPAAALDPS